LTRRFTAILMLIIFTSTICYGQETDRPAPYRPEEFPQWTLDLRRAEVITVGSFPLSFMITALVYDLSYLAIDSYNYNKDPGSYQRASFASHRTQDDIARLLLISGGISLTIGLTDFIINRVKEKKAEREAQELNEQRTNNSESATDSEAED